jgi:hypothetical protein
VHFPLALGPREEKITFVGKNYSKILYSDHGVLLSVVSEAECICLEVCANNDNYINELILTMNISLYAFSHR